MANKPPLLSKNANQCLTACIPKGTAFIHPVSIDGLMSKTFDVCAIEPILGEDNVDAKWIEECNIEDNINHSIPDASRNLMLSFHFSPVDFLRGVYGITSLEDAIYWTSEHENTVPFNTVKRVHNSAWLAFGLKEGVSNNVISYYYNAIIDYWIKSFIDRLRQEYTFTEETDLKSLLIDKYLTKTFVAKALKKFVKRPDWGDITDFYSAAVWSVYDAMVNKMEPKSIG